MSPSPSSSSSPQHRPRRIRKRVVAQLVVSLACLALVYRKVSPELFFQALQKISIYSGATMILLYLLGQLVSAAKWRVLINQAGISRSYGETAKAYFMGMFFNAFGIGTVSGDIARAVALKPAKGERAAAIATVAADRIHGLLVLMSIGTISVLLVQPPVLGTNAAPLAAVGAIALLVVWLAGPGLLLSVFPADHRFASAAQKAAAAFPRKLKPLGLTTLLSTAFHLSQLMLFYYIAHLVGAQISFPYVLATVPLVNVAATLPLSVNGLGVREALTVLFFVPVGVDREMAVAIAAIWFTVVTVVSAVGGILLYTTVSALLRRADTVSYADTVSDEPALRETPEDARVLNKLERRALG